MKLHMRVGVKDLVNFFLCPNMLRNRLQGLPPKIDERVATGYLVHATRQKLNPSKRRLAKKEGLLECIECHVASALDRLRYMIPTNLDGEAVTEHALGIMVGEWKWESGLLREHQIDMVYPIRMEDHVKMPPGIYGRVDGILRDKTPLPIEYKTWDLGLNHINRLQLWAYCMGVEFKYRTKVPFGVLQYGDPPKRIRVGFTRESRKVIFETYHELLSFLRTGGSPRQPDPKACTMCLYPTCEFRVE